jgi:hypothetical protein
MSNQTVDLDQGIRDHLQSALRGGNAFESFDEIVRQIPEPQRFIAAGTDGRSAWQIVEHMRRTLTDLAEYIGNEHGSYVELNWPEDYWPTTANPSGDEGWDKSVRECKKATDRIEALLMDRSKDLLSPFPWGDGQTLMREVLLAVEHTAYHLGELIELTVCLKA